MFGWLAALLSVLVVLLACLAVWLRTQRNNAHELLDELERGAREERNKAQQAALAVRQSFDDFSEPLLWARWWARNACEERDPEVREILLRCATHALLVDGSDAMREEMHALLAEREGLHSPKVRVFVEACLREALAPEKPWVRWVREEPGRLMHLPEALEVGRARALRGRLAAGGGLDGSPQFARMEGSAPESSTIS